MRYLPHTESDLRKMLETIGVASVDALFESVPSEKRLQRDLALEPGLDEVQLTQELDALAARNTSVRALSFLGAGIYDHHVPPLVDQMLTRGEWLTAYTPYQPEVSQGTLQAVFEFQTIVSEVLGLPVANASLYDGASAAAEGALMARRLTRKNTVLVSRALHPEYREVVETYLQGVTDAKYEELPYGPNGSTELQALEQRLAQADDVACVLVGHPNFFGIVEDLPKLAELVHAKGALLVSCTAEAQSLSVVAAPGTLGADIATAEGQALGIPPQLGGPGCGLFACKNTRDFVQNLPGRLCGETVDLEGRRGFVLTLSTREQHIRREKATSNICTNQGLMALAITVRMSLLGRTGYQTLGKLCFSRTEFLKQALQDAGFELAFAGPTFNEFAVRCKGHKASAVLEKLEAKHNILAGVDLGRWYPELTDCVLVAVTERHGRAELESLVSALKSAVA